MGKIYDAEFIGGTVTAKIWDADDIGGGARPFDPTKITILANNISANTTYVEGVDAYRLKNTDSAVITIKAVYTDKPAVGVPGIKLVIYHELSRRRIDNAAFDDGATPLLANGKVQPQNTISEVYTTGADGTVAVTYSQPGGPGVNNVLQFNLPDQPDNPGLTITLGDAGVPNIIFSTQTSPDTDKAAMWGHMPEAIGGLMRPLLDAESTAGNKLPEDGNNETWANIGYSDLIALCGSEANIPSESDLKALVSSEGDIGAKYGWPMVSHYWSSTEYSEPGQHVTVMLTDGSVDHLLDTNQNLPTYYFSTGPVVTSFITNPGTSQSFTFPYVEGFGIQTVFVGARMQLVTSGGTAPYIFTSDNPAVADIDQSAMIIWNGRGRVTFTITDTLGATGTAVFEPGQLFIQTNNWVHPSESAPLVESQGLRIPLYTELVAGVGMRKIGSLYGEWGDFKLNGSGWPPYNHGSESGDMYHFWAQDTYIAMIADDNLADGGGFNQITEADYGSSIGIDE
ncbi:adhesion domain-containing protein [Citrobacter werkmanii]|uniref:adhesion domain-containing protein n=1 Tax=Citrobacter werkmanii TaxID=67827 RepID=UPI00300D394F